MYSAGNGTLSNVEAMGSLVKTPLHIRDGPMIAVFWDNVVVNAAFFLRLRRVKYSHGI